MKTVRVCMGHKCGGIGKQIFDRAVAEVGENTSVSVEVGNCQGRCSRGPIVVVEGGGEVRVFEDMDPLKVCRFVRK